MLVSIGKIMNNGSRITFKLLAIVFFLLAITSMLATLFAVSGSDRSPGLFLAVFLAGVGKWLWGKSQGKSAQRDFRARNRSCGHRRPNRNGRPVEATNLNVDLAHCDKQ